MSGPKLRQKQIAAFGDDLDVGGHAGLNVCVRIGYDQFDGIGDDARAA